MGKRKLKRWKENSTLDNVFEYTDFADDSTKKPKGKWSAVFGNTNPIVLELACGKGEYTLNLARRYPEKNFIGIDIKGARIWVGANQAKEQSLVNVRYIRMYIDHIEEYFADGEIDEIWITFPDPYLKGSRKHKRLTSARFLDRYRRILKEEGVIHLKTDSDLLYEFTIGVLAEEGCDIKRLVKDVYSEAPEDPHLTIPTHYERENLKVNKTIKYVSFIP
jgi:tRNA (guanine-N7-)-methyltransferase